MQKKLQKELGSAAQKEDEPANPLLHVAEEMRGVQQQLDHRDSGRPTQDCSSRIVADLAKLIDDAKKSGSCSGGAVSNGPKRTTSNPGAAAQNQGRPPATSSPKARDSDPAIRKAEDRAAAAAIARTQLLERFRAALQGRKGEPMLEKPSEEYFLPEYKLEIEDYFRRLSEDQPEPVKP